MVHLDLLASTDLLKRTYKHSINKIVNELKSIFLVNIHVLMIDKSSYRF